MFKRIKTAEVAETAWDFKRFIVAGRVVLNKLRGI